MDVLLVSLAMIGAFAALVIVGRMRILRQERRREFAAAQDLAQSLERFERLAPEHRAVLAGLPDGRSTILSSQTSKPLCSRGSTAYKAGNQHVSSSERPFRRGAVERIWGPLAN